MSVDNTYEMYIRGLMERRVQTLKERAEHINKKWGPKRLGVDNPANRADRAFLEQYAVGLGIDVCCGDFLIGEDTSIGVDTRKTVLGADYHFSGDDLSFAKPGEMDYVITNYMEAMPNVIKAINEWYRVLKPGGTLAIVCRNAETYPGPEGALKNRHRVHTFTKVTLSHYLGRCNFVDLKIKETTHQSLHVAAKKAS